MMSDFLIGIIQLEGVNDDCLNDKAVISRVNIHSTHHSGLHHFLPKPNRQVFDCLASNLNENDALVKIVCHLAFDVSLEWRGVTLKTIDPRKMIDQKKKIDDRIFFINYFSW